MDKNGTDTFATRFDTYVKELRIVFDRGGLSYGSPEDLAPFGRVISAPGVVRDAVISAMQSVLAREQEDLSRTELVSILVVAAGGVDMYASAKETEAVKQLRTFVGESVVRVQTVEDVVAPDWTAAGSGFVETETVETLRSAAVEEAGGGRIRRPDGRGGRLIWIGAAYALTILLLVGAMWRHRSAGLARFPSSAAVVAPVPTGTVVGQQMSTPSSEIGAEAAAGALGASKREAVSGPSRSAIASPEQHAGGTTKPVEAVGPTPAQPQVPVAKAEQPPVVAAAGRTRGRGPRPSPSGQPAVAAQGIGGNPGKFLVSSGVMSGNLIASPEPAYPKMAKMWGVEGQVILQAVVSRKGDVVSAKALDGHRMLRGAATNAVRKWRYKPYMVHGKAEDVATVVIVNFKLKP